MIVIPAIDLLQGKVVRLVKGDPARSTVYSDNPPAVAKQWQDKGARLIHVVDLDAALGRGDNSAVIKDILSAVKVKVQVGGGVRSLEKAEELISWGAQRVVIGTKSLDSVFLEAMLDSLGAEKVAVGVDVIEGMVAVQGWQKKTAVKGGAFIKHLEEMGVEWVICTDISRDGTLGGINLGVIKEFSASSSMNFIASGGVSCLEDIEKIKKQAPAVWGVIVGKALYDGRVILSKSIC